METRQEIFDKIQQDIAEITTPRGIKKVKVVEVLQGLLNLSSPSMSNNQARELYSLDGNTIYQKVLFEPDGNNLSNMDLSIPSEASLIGLTSIAEDLKKFSAQITAHRRTSFPAGDNSVTFVGADDNFVIGGFVVTSADLEFVIRNTTTNQDTSFFAEYTQGNNIIIDLPEDVGSYRIEQVNATNILGGGSLPGFTFVDVEMSFIINGVQQDGSFQISEMTGANIAYQYFNFSFNTWQKLSRATTIDLQIYPGSLELTGGIESANINFRVSFSDNTSEDFNLIYSSSDNDPYSFELQKDLTGLDDQTSMTIEVLPGSTVTNEAVTLPIEVESIVANIHLEEFTDGDLLAIYDNVLTNLFNGVVSGFVTSVRNGALANNPEIKNAFVTITYMVEPDPAP